MKKFASALLIAAAPLAAYAWTPLLHSRSALVYDVGRQEVLFEKDPDTAQPVASLTKLMTAMVVLDEAQSMEAPLTIDDADIDRLKHSGSRIPVGTTLERGEMLRLTLMSSENRAASALSRAFPGGEPAFVRKMNDKARALRMTDTYFDDPTGLSPADVSTARDVVKMAEAASHYPLIGVFSVLPHYEEVVGSRTRFYRNTDPLVDWPDWNVRLAKTGYIREAGRCILVETDMPRGPVIIALLGARSSRARSADLVTIRRWLDGDEAPVVIPRVYAASTQPHYRRVVGKPHRVNVQFSVYQSNGVHGAHRMNGKHPVGKHLRLASGVYHG
jgi:D-alanyl-D-alanine endopeptidase (penicillin-binding protein 7)